MILQVLDKEGDYRITLRENGMETSYDAGIHICPNPVCICNTVDLSLTPVSDDGETAQRAPAWNVRVDVERKKLADNDEVKKRGPARDFAKKVLKQMDEEDFQFLLTRYLATKKLQTDKARPEEIDAWFEYDRIEEEGLLTAYKDILPYSDLLLVTLNGEQCAVLDQYCLRKGCSCTEACLNIYRIETGKMAVGEEIGCYFVDYRKKKWWIADGTGARKGWIDLQTARRAIQEQIPSIYALMKVRHARLMKIYNHCRAKQGGLDIGKQAPVVKVGRNDPCPCGSGRKYKKCCLAK